MARKFFTAPFCSSTIAWIANNPEAEIFDLAAF